MINKKRRLGFTIVELVIVIAVIAILAAVLIPTFSNLIKKTKMSVDQQAVRQMNLILAQEEVNRKIEDISDAIIALRDNGFEANSYRPATVDTNFYWIKSVNRVVHADDEYNMLYPESSSFDTNVEYSADNWFCLAETFYSETEFIGGIGTKEKPYLISNGEQLVNGITTIESAGHDETVYYSLVSDVELPGNYAFESYNTYSRVLKLDNAVLDGNGYTIDFLNQDYAALIYEMKNSKIENLKIANNAYTFAERLVGTNVFEDVDVISGSYNVDASNNYGAYAIFDFGDVKFLNCDNNMNVINTTNLYQNAYNAAFIGQIVKNDCVSMQTGDVITNAGEYLTKEEFENSELTEDDVWLRAPWGSYNACHPTNRRTVNIEFTNCSYSGILQSSRAAMFIGNSNMGVDITLTVNNCTNKGTIQATYQKYNNYDLDWYHYESSDDEWSNPDVVNYFSANGIGNGERAQSFTLILDGVTYREYEVKNAKVQEADGGQFIFAPLN